MNGVKSSRSVFGQGILQIVDNAFFRLPYQSVSQMEKIKDRNSIRDDDWNELRTGMYSDHRREGGCSEHGLPNISSLTFVLLQALVSNLLQVGRNGLQKRRQALIPLALRVRLVLTAFKAMDSRS